MTHDSQPSHRITVYLLLTLLLVAPATVNADSSRKTVVGWIERVTIPDAGLTLEAKVDTGADYSSVHAEDIQITAQDGTTWVAFRLIDRAGGQALLRRPLVRMAEIKKKTGGFQQRPVVSLELCVGEIRRPAQVNLAERGHFSYPMLLGRDFLQPDFLVDPATRYLLPPACGNNASTRR